MDGNFIGTTDEIIQWASCKWGFNDDITRAQALVESSWDMTKYGDLSAVPSTCPPDERSKMPCPESFGLLQMKVRFHPGSYPWVRRSTAFHLDYALAERRGCFDGLAAFGSGYQAGDLWRCIGSWFTGTWEEAPARDYVQRVRTAYATKPWRSW